MMRIAPVLIPYLRSGGTGLWADAALAAMLTHNDRGSTSACVAFVGMLWELLDMDQPPESHWWLERYVALARDLERASSYSPRGGAFTDYRGPLWRFAKEQVSAAYEQRLSVVDACRGWYSGAYMLETVPSVLYILMRYGDDPEEAIIRAVNDTKDNDTIAAIVGAAVGALHGRQALPARWIENLSGRTTDRDDGRVFELIADARRVFWTQAPQQSPPEIRPDLPDRSDRARAALLAHACGDRFGAPLEFVRGASVRTREVHLANWTDDTHMSLYLGEAILAHGSGPLEADRFGEAVGDAFLRWLNDPLMPSTAPGRTCIAGVRHFERDHDWKTCGIQSSDGCGAVMRIVPLALAFHGGDLLEAARISAIVTHAHPNALEAAMAGAWLVGQVLDTGRWDGELVEEAIRGLEGPWSQGGNVADSLRAASAWAQRGEDWLDERMIPPGDGGWRSGSALGLAVAAALRWSGDLELAVEKAARIQGDSDSVACLTGALLGAALGTEAIPPRWLATLPRRTEIAGLADRLVVQAATATARRQVNSPLVVIADLHGHLDLFEMLFLPDAIRNKALAKLNDPTWERVVVSGHTHLQGQAVFSASQRVCVSATSDHGGGLLAGGLARATVLAGGTGGGGGRVGLMDVADLTVHTVAEILHVPPPGFLAYEAFDADGHAILLPSLGLQRVAH